MAKFLGRTLRYTYEFVEFIPGERLIMRSRQGPFPMETTYTWDPAPDVSTRMTLRNRGGPAGFSMLMAPIMKPAMRRDEPQGPRQTESDPRVSGVLSISNEHNRAMERNTPTQLSHMHQHNLCS